LKDVGGDRKMMTFETVTLAPIDLACVEPSLLTSDERTWLNDYHARVRKAHQGKLDAETAAWVEQATQAI
jgi:Xaa-Pro aminopeptidase